MRFSELLDFILEFEGIIGALLGVIATMIVSRYLNNRGKIKVRLIESSSKGYYINRYGDYIEIDDKSEAQHWTVEFTLELYNESESPKYLKDFKIEWYDKNGNCISKTELDSLDSRRLSAGCIRYDSISYINLEPKKIMKQGFRCSIQFKGNDELKNFSKIYFSYTNERNKTKSILLTNLEA